MPEMPVRLRRAAAGFQRVHLAAGYLAELIEAYFRDGERFGVQLEYLREDQPLGTAGPLAALANPSERLLVMNGDLFTALDFRELVAFHESSGATATGRDARARGADRVRRDRGRGDANRRLRRETDDCVRREHGRLRFRAGGRGPDPERRALRLPRRRARPARAGLAGRRLPLVRLLARHRQREDYELAQERFDELRGELLPDEGQA